eukprot:g6348.t1
MNSFGDLSALSSLIESAQKNSDENSSIVARNKYTQRTSGMGGYVDEPDEYAEAMAERSENMSKDIWLPDEIPEKIDIEVNDDRPRPPFKIQYKQNVSSEDMFLGMSGVSPSMAECQYMVVLVRFPGCQLQDIEIDVTKKVLLAQSSLYRLRLALPYPVREKDGKATFDSTKGELSVTLPIEKQDLPI